MARQYAKFALEGTGAQKDMKWRDAQLGKLKRKLQFFELPQKVDGLLRVEDVNETFKPNRYFLTGRESELFDHIDKMRNVSIRLAEMDVSYINSTMLTGQSGVGKTMFGRYLAYKMGYPLVYVDFSHLVDSLMGNTAKNIVKAFDYASSENCILFLDEIDYVASKRRSGSSGADRELGNVAISLMQALDSMPNESVVLAATNIPESLDPAVLRRFKAIHKVEPLTPDEQAETVICFLNDIGVNYDHQKARLFGFEHEGSTSSLISGLIERIANSLLADDFKAGER